MIAVIFEVSPAEGKLNDYLDMAARLKPELDKIEGFISIERFQSVTDPAKILSLSFWKDEASITQWRNVNDYRLRVASVIRDYGMKERAEAPNDSKVVHQ